MKDFTPSNKMHVYTIQIVFALAISITASGINVDNVSDWIGTTARYIIYLYLIRGSRLFIAQALRSWAALDPLRLYREHQKHWLIFAGSVAVVVYHKQSLIDEQFLLLFIGHLIFQYPDMEKLSRTVTYGTGMACSYFEGYLMHVIPSDGHRFVGFEENIIAFEGDQSIRFPVRRLFIVITKDMFCPPDLKQLDERLEACKSLEDVVKNVAGVQNRSYKNSAYKIHRAGRPPVYLAVECATPIHTLYLVLKNRNLYHELDGIDEAEVVSDFISMLGSIMSKSPECRNKCELVYFDNSKDSTQRLSELLLERIRQIEPNFEEIIREDAASRQSTSYQNGKLELSESESKCLNSDGEYISQNVTPTGKGFLDASDIDKNA